MDIESDLRKIERELDEALKDNYNHYLFQEGDKKTEEELKQRHDLEVKLLTELLKLRESLAKEDLTRGFIDQERYQSIVKTMKQKLIQTVLKFQNKL